MLSTRPLAYVLQGPELIFDRTANLAPRYAGTPIPVCWSVDAGFYTWRHRRKWALGFELQHSWVILAVTPFYLCISLQDGHLKAPRFTLMPGIYTVTSSCVRTCQLCVGGAVFCPASFVKQYPLCEWLEGLLYNLLDSGRLSELQVRIGTNIWRIIIK